MVASGASARPMPGGADSSRAETLVLAVSVRGAGKVGFGPAERAGP